MVAIAVSSAVTVVKNVVDFGWSKNENMEVNAEIYT